MLLKFAVVFFLRLLLLVCGNCDIFVLRIGRQLIYKILIQNCTVSCYVNNTGSLERLQLDSYSTNAPNNMNINTIIHKTVI